jgi:hypothetical protein
MSKSSTFLGWLAGGAGVVLVYSAYKNESPISVLKGSLTGDGTRSNIAPVGAGAYTDQSVTSRIDPGSPAAGKLSGVDVARIAYNAGFRGQALIEMVAIAKRESNFNPNAHNTNAGTGDNSYGLWQINMLGNLGPSRLKSFGLSSNDQLLDAATNARAAFILSGGGQNLSPWGGYKGLSNTYNTDVSAAEQYVRQAGF